MKTLSKNYSKIAFFTDIHFGKSKDSVLKLETCEKFIDWFCGELKSNSVDAAIFCGDWFDNRNSISVVTMNYAYNCLKKIAEVCPIYMIVGNHDSSLKTGLGLNSLRQFNDIENVEIVQDNLILEAGKDCRILLCPWDKYFDLPDEMRLQRSVDILTGHFEFNGAALINSVFDKSAFGIGDLAKISPLVFSGHFHVHKEYATDNGKIVVIGSPLELEWGDIDNQKGYYLLDCRNKSYTFVPNTLSPIHVKLYLSRLKTCPDYLATEKVTGNYVKLLIDEKFEYEDLTKAIEKINALNPLRACFIEYLYTMSFDSPITDPENLETIATTVENLEMGIFEYVKKYINCMDDSYFEESSKERIITLAETYFTETEKRMKE